MRGVVLASLLAAARGAASWNESYVDGLLHAGAVAKVEGLLPASSFRLDALVAALGDAAWAEPLVHLSSERGAQAALGSYADVAAAVAAGDASAVLRLEKLAAPGAAVAAALGGDGLGWALDRGDSVHVYWSGPGGAALRNHTDRLGGARRARGARDAHRRRGRRAEAAVVSLATRRARRRLRGPPRGLRRLRRVRRRGGLRRGRRVRGRARRRGAVSVADRDGSQRVAVERGALADVAVDGASRGAAADDFFAAVAAAAPAASGPLAKLRARGQGRDGAVAAFAVDDGSVEVGLAAPRGALPQVLDCVAESGVVDASRDGATGLRVAAAASAVTGAATVTSAAGGDVALARRRALQTTTWRVGNACAVGTYGSGYGELQRGPYTAQTYAQLPDGAYAPSNGLTACTVCEVGKYAMAAGSCACTLCEPGTYAPATETVLCTECEAGRYQSAFGATTCYDCPEGFFCPTQADGATACPAGKYSGANAEDCISCPDGYYSDADCDGDDAGVLGGITSCEPCAAGTYPSTSNADCISCDAGTYSPGGQETCTECPAGAYCGTGSSSYTICEAGKYAISGSSSCSSCAAGRFLADDGATLEAHDTGNDCVVCDAGRYSASSASGSCAACAEGTFLWDETLLDELLHDNANDCSSCPEGTYSGAGASSCAACDAGAFAAGEGNSARGLWCASGGCHECTDCELCTNENHEPTFAVGDATLDLGAVDENGGFAIIGELGASDIENDYLDYVITAGDDAGLFSAANNILYVVADAGLDFETATSYTLTIEATEAYTTEQYSATVTVLVTVNDVNDIAMTAASPSTLSVVGGEAVVITGANLGPYGDAAGVDVTMTYGNGADGATYAAAAP
ncbi:calcium ion binding protein [Aureococcus anophagefferens]|nr:calcium ion binding protein [Aureococcus anophagefferens]